MNRVTCRVSVTGFMKQRVSGEAGSQSVGYTLFAFCALQIFVTVCSGVSTAVD
jgi:hypothetical protein